MSLSTALETLANYRAHNTRASQDIVDKGKLLLNNTVSKLGDDGIVFFQLAVTRLLTVGLAWSFLEQLV
jgi:hypothetical protein